MNNDTWPPPPTEQKTAAPKHFRGGRIDVLVNGDLLTLKFTWRRFVVFASVCALLGVVPVTIGINLLHALIVSPHILVPWMLHGLATNQKHIVMTLLGVFAYCGAIAAVLWASFDRCNRYLYRIASDGSLTGGGFRPKHWNGLQYVRMCDNRIQSLDRKILASVFSFSTEGSRAFVLGFEEQVTHRVLRVVNGKPNEIALAVTYKRAAAERAAEMIGDFLGARVIIE